jgi:TatD DNase family protein
MVGSSTDTEPNLVDTHAHLDFSRFDGDLDRVLERAGSAGVAFVVTVGFDIESSRRAVALAEKHANVKACVGVHPHEASTVTSSVLESLGELAGHKQVVGVGEIGLDYYRDRSPRAAQRRALRQQLDLAADLGKPVVIHDRDAHEDVMGMIREWSRAVTSSSEGLRPPLGVVHCFSGDQAMAAELCELGFLISVAGPVTYQNARGLQGLVGRISLEKLLIETDCPFLSPHPFRGKRNEPGYVRLVGSKVAEIKDTTLAEVARVTTENAHQLFRF